ncbi:MAG: hypothetical protein KAI72_09700, partial [Candidatus Pacebacteria bacterium]|nr:hypothetical protein [Candidatus Paceibacterota bacterium]
KGLGAYKLLILSIKNNNKKTKNSQVQPPIHSLSTFLTVAGILRACYTIIGCHFYLLRFRGLLKLNFQTRKNRPIVRGSFFGRNLTKHLYKN